MQVESQTTPIVQPWVFTFGCGQAYAGRFVVIAGTYRNARDEVNRRHGNRWSMVYDSREAAGVERFGLVELK